MLVRTLKSLLARPQAETVSTQPLEERIPALLRQKRLDEAESLLNGVDKVDSQDPLKLALLAELRVHQNMPEEAERLAQHALRLQPGLAIGHYVLSVIYYDAGRFEEALTQAHYARNRTPGDARVLAQLGLCAIALQEYGMARDVLRQAVLLDPEDVPALNNLAIAHHAMQEPAQALYCLQRALALKPDYTPARENLKNLFGIDPHTVEFNPQTLSLETRFDGGVGTSTEDEAARTEALEAAFDARPEDVDTAVALIEHHLRALRLEAARDVLTIAAAHNPQAPRLLLVSARLAQNLGQLKRARAQYEAVIAQQPDNVRALLGLAQVLRDLNLHEEAVIPAQQAALAAPEDTGVLFQLASAQVNACQYEQALATYDRVEALRPELAPFLLSGRAVSHTYLGHFATARALLEEAKATGIDNAGFSVFQGMLHLLHEDYGPGWDAYRWRHLNDAHHLRLPPYPLWQGEPLEDKTVLILAEQGLGDQVMFASCLPDLLALKPRTVILEANARVAKTLARSFPQVRVHPSNQRDFDWLPRDTAIDFYAPIADLPRHFRRSREAFPQYTGYLVADPARVAHWRQRLDALDDRPKIGFTWRGGLQQTRRAIRSLTLERLAPLLADERFHFVNLQYGQVQEELAAFCRAQGLSVTDWPEAIADLDEFAALVSALDLVITVCNTTVHYAGALGRPCWVLAPYVPEWRYGLTGPQMRWYPSVRMFRQPAMHDWDSVLTELRTALAAWSCA